MKQFDYNKYIKNNPLLEGFQGDEPSGDGLSGFRGKSGNIPATHAMSPIQQVEAIQRVWAFVGRENKEADDRTLCTALYKMFDKMGYAICHK